jgi:hypothetical protein
MYSSGMVVTLTPWHHGPAASLRIRSKAYVELTCPWPERADMDVPMVVCMAVMVGKLGPVPSDEQIALWNENLASSCHTTRVGVSRARVFQRFCTSCGRLRRRMRKRIRLLHASRADACSNPARLRWPCRRRPGEVQNRPTTSCANVKVLLSIYLV